MKELSDVIEFQSLVQIMSMFKFNCTIEDENDLRFWLYNKDVLTKTPKFYIQDRLYLDCDKLIEKLREESRKLKRT